MHCILHQKAICSKSLKIKEVMDLVVKTINCIQSWGLNHRQFKSFFADMDSKHGKILYHTEVQWLSRGKVLKRFLSLEIYIFLCML